jgi:hypothetical protein
VERGLKIVGKVITFTPFVEGMALLRIITIGVVE